MTNANNADRAAVCVFCGAAEGSKPHFVDAARELAEILTSEGLGLVYGAGGVGVMGAPGSSFPAGRARRSAR